MADFELNAAAVLSLIKGTGNNLFVGIFLRREHEANLKLAQKFGQSSKLTFSTGSKTKRNYAYQPR
ncbi:MAG: hypothetical protein HEQ35_30935 [Gloeotrichia echinulata IR180]